MKCKISVSAWPRFFTGFGNRYSVISSFALLVLSLPGCVRGANVEETETQAHIESVRIGQLFSRLRVPLYMCRDVLLSTCGVSHQAIFTVGDTEMVPRLENSYPHIVQIFIFVITVKQRQRERYPGILFREIFR